MTRKIPGHDLEAAVRAAPPRPFSFPHEVLDDPSLNYGQKRALLCEWASDACAVESFPTLRRLPGTNFPVTLSAVMDALHQLDRTVARQVENAAAQMGVIAQFARKRGSGHSPRS